MMVYVVKETLDVSFYKPFRSCKQILDRVQCGVAASFGAKSMRGIFKCPS